MKDLKTLQKKSADRRSNREKFEKFVMAMLDFDSLLNC